MVASAAVSGVGRPPGNGVGGAGDQWVDVPALAWEFLRRNPDYRADYAMCAQSPRGVRSTLDQRWGLRFPADPQLSAQEADVFWRPEVAPGVVLALEPDRGRREGDSFSSLPIGRSRSAEDGLHVRTPWGLQLFLKGMRRADRPLAVALSFDENFGLRVRAVDVLHRVSSGRPPPQSRLTRAQRLRLDRCLIALDAALEGASYRETAERLFGASDNSEPWKTGTVRAVTIRLVKAGRALMGGGYLKLLRDGL